MTTFCYKFCDVWFSQKNENYMPNECIRSCLSFGIYFSTFCENHTLHNLSPNDAIAFFKLIFALWKHSNIISLIFLYPSGTPPPPHLTQVSLLGQPTHKHTHTHTHTPPPHYHLLLLKLRCILIYFYVFSPIF